MLGPNFVTQLKAFKGRGFASFFLIFFIHSSPALTPVSEKRSPHPPEKSTRKRTQSDACEDRVPSSEDRVPFGVLFLSTKRTQSNASEELICDPLLLCVCFVGDDMGVIPKRCVQKRVMRTVHAWRIIESVLKIQIV